MIFAYTYEEVLRGEKSQTRRVIRPGEHLDGQRMVKNGQRTVYQVGKTYAVQPGRTEKAVARIQLTAIRKERVEDISEADAIAEGYTTREAFFAAWRTIHGANADLSADIWVLAFELV